MWWERRVPALGRGGEVQLDRLSARARARLHGKLFGAGLEDQRRDFLRAVDADPGPKHPAARAVATRLVRCQSEVLARHAATLAAAQRTVNRNIAANTARPRRRGDRIACYLLRLLTAANGTKRTWRGVFLSVRFWGEADIHGHVALPTSVATDPEPT